MTRCLAVVAATVLIATALLRCADSRPAWIPAGYAWEKFPTEGGRRLVVAWPGEGTEEGPRPMAMLVHGGGWTGGRPDEMLPVAELVASLGYRPVLVEYRRLGDATSLGEPVADLRSAWRHLVARAEVVGGEVDGSIVIGGSAGGHLALWAFAESSGGRSAPSAMILLCPVLDASPETGFGADTLGDSWRRWSPRHAPLRSALPMLVLHGKEDQVVDPDSSAAASAVLRAAGGDVDFRLVPGLPHGFYARGDELAVVEPLMREWLQRQLEAEQP